MLLHVAKRQTEFNSGHEHLQKIERFKRQANEDRFLALIVGEGEPQSTPIAGGMGTPARAFENELQRERMPIGAR